MFLAVFNVSASTYTTDTNLFENSYSNNLIDMAESNIDNFYTKDFVIFQSGYNYYLIVGDDYSINNHNITFTNSTIIRAIRNQSNYNYYYDYSVITENSTSLNISNIIISNIDSDFSVSSSRFNSLRSNKYLINCGIMIIGLLFAIFLSRERRL